jgi:FkbM family methyltransferase
MKYFLYHYLSKITLYLLGKLRKYHIDDDQLLVFSHDFIGEIVFCYGTYEKDQILSIMNSLNFDKSSANCLDIGANIGNHSIKFSNYFKSVHCFEPNPEVYEVLRLNTKKKENIKTYNFGLSNKNENLYLSFNKQNHGAGNIVSSLANNKKGFEIELKVLDDFFTEKVAFIKIDIEGHEISAIEGMIGLLREQKPVISFEYIKSLNGDEIIKKLKELGYDKFYIPFENNFLKRNLPHSLLFIGFLFGGFFKPKYRLIELNEPNKNFYNLIVAENSNSNYGVNIKYHN